MGRIIASTNVTIDGLSSSCYFFAVHVREDAAPYEVGGRYEDRVVETAVGWRIKERTLVTIWQR